MMAQVLVLAEARLRLDDYGEDEFEADNILTLSEDEFVRVVARCGGSVQGHGPTAKKKGVDVDHEATDAQNAA